VPETAYHSGIRDKHNRLQWDSNFGPLTPQLSTLTTRGHCNTIHIVATPLYEQQDITPERGSAAHDTTAAFHFSLHRATAEKCVVLNTPLPEVLSPVTRWKVKLNRVFTIHLTPWHSLLVSSCLRYNHHTNVSNVRHEDDALKISIHFLLNHFQCTFISDSRCYNWQNALFHTKDTKTVFQVKQTRL